MSFRAKRELLLQVRPRYQEAVAGQRRGILDEFLAATGYACKYAIRLLAQTAPLTVGPIRWPRPHRYGRAVAEALTTAWAAANDVCAKRLVPFLPELVPVLERHDHLQLTDEVRDALLHLSPATADRLLRTARAHDRPHGIGTTKAGRLLKHQAPIGTFTEWTDLRPGFMEADAVAHCGGMAEGSYLSTPTLTDVATGWTECLPLLHRTHEAVLHALEQARRTPRQRMRAGLATDEAQGRALQFARLVRQGHGA
jgi:hypothetical protein